MKLSIITINLNNCDGLKRTIDSVVSQTFRDFEWIIIDGGSSDGSKKLIEEHTEHFAYWVSESDNGIYNAMNKGVAHSIGEYCLFLNSGDYLNDENILSIVSNYLIGDIIYGDVNICGKDGVVGKCFSPKHLSLSFFYQSTICHQSSFIKRSLLTENPYDESFRCSSDWKFFFQAALCNRSFKYIPFVICNYSINGVSSNFVELYNERVAIISSTFPQLIINDISLYNKFSSHLANTTPTVFIELCEKHVLFSKVITAIILLMKKIK